MGRRAWQAVVLMGAVLTACNGQRDGSRATSTASSASAPAARGTAAPGNDPAVLSLLEAALGCPWDQGAFQRDCAAFAAWEQSKLFEEGKADPTLLNLLDDAREQVRYLAASRLQVHGKAYRQDKAMAQHVLDAARTETGPSAATELGAAVAGIDVAATGLDAAIEKLMQPGAESALRRSIIARVLTRNPSFYERIKAIAKDDPDREIRLAALSGFWAGTPPDRYAQSCAFWRERAEGDADDTVAGEAAYLAALYPQAEGCAAEYDALLAAIEKKAKAGTVQSAQMGAALANLHGQQAASTAQKKRALGVAKAIVENAKNGEFARARALQLVGEKDAGGKAYADKYKDDAAPAVKAAAERLVSADKAPAGG